MQASRLFKLGAIYAARLNRIEGHRRGGEEAERIKVTAHDTMRLNDLIGAPRPQPKGPVGVAGLLIGQPIDHGPFVQAEAAKRRRAARLSP